jgi:hypothetical protein
MGSQPRWLGDYRDSGFVHQPKVKDGAKLHWAFIRKLSDHKADIG